MAWAAVGVAGIPVLLTVIRLVNKIVFEAPSIYLYDIHNLGTATAGSSEMIGYQKPVIIFLIGIAVILGTSSYRKRRQQNGN